MLPPEEIRPILESAVDLFVETGAVPDFSQLSDRAGIPAADLEAAFGSPGDILDRFFADLVTRCAEMVDGVGAEDFEGRVAAFAFIMFDLLEERRPFAEATFGARAARWGSPFRSALGVEMSALLSASDVPGINETVLTLPPFSFVTVDTFVRLVQTWLEDDTKNRERSVALVDRLVRFYAAAATNPTATLGVDAVKYAAEAGYLPAIPFVTDWLFGASDKEGGPGDGPAAEDARV